MEGNRIMMNMKTLFYYFLGFVFFALVISVMCIRYVTIGGKEYERSADSLIITDSDFAGCPDYSFLKKFPKLRTLDLTSIDLPKKQYELIMSSVDAETNVICNIIIGDVGYKTDIETLSVPAEIIGDYSDAFSVFNNLKSFEVVGTAQIDALYDTIQAVRKNNPDVECVYSSSILGIPLDSSTEKLTLDNKKIDNVDTVRHVIELFPNIKKFDMCDCGVSDEEMGKLREEYPDRKFKWMLHILIYDIPTDVQVFSTLVGKWIADIDATTFVPIFKYCTDLRALDLGHWDNISDISEMRNLKNLEILIISDNSISDVSPLGELKHLKYMDLRYNKITDVSPLTSLQELQFLEIGGNRLKNAEELCKCKSLKYLYIQDAVIPAKSYRAIYDNLPKGCEFKTQNTRGHKWYRKIISMFRRWKKVKVYHDWMHVEFYA